MKQIVDSAQMKALDEQTIQKMGVPALVLMERAALAVVEELKAHFDLKKTLVVCGCGNNGGDGIAVARMLHLEGYEVDLYLAGDAASFTKEAGTQWEIARNYGNSVVKNCCPAEYTTIVDAVFGVGLSREVTGCYRELFEQINQSCVPVLAVDIPSGICGSTGQVMGCAVRAKRTVTFAYGKTGLYFYPGAAYSGDVSIRDVGIYGEVKNPLYVLEEKEREWIPVRREEGNKGTFGKVLVAAGSKNMSGAAYFAARASLLTGSGMVRIFTEECNRLILQQLFPEAMLTTYEPQEEPEMILEKLEQAHQWADAAVAGPGLGMSKTAEAIVMKLAEMETEKPLVVDADGLNLLSKKKEVLKNIRRPCVLTPHIGEMSRLSGDSIEMLKQDPHTCLKRFVKGKNLAVILKDARTLIWTKEGNQYLNLTGNSGMATAGSGDVLAGMTAGLLAQGLSLSKAAPLAVWLHGKAGDAAAVKRGKYGMTASDLLEAVPDVLAQ